MNTESSRIHSVLQPSLTKWLAAIAESGIFQNAPVKTRSNEAKISSAASFSSF